MHTSVTRQLRLPKLDTGKAFGGTSLSGATTRKCAENSAFDIEVLVNQPLAHAELIATFRRAQTDAAHKFGLIKAVEKKGPKAIQAAIETAAKAAKRRDSYAKSLSVLGVTLEE
jgi:hypothetical protein